MAHTGMPGSGSAAPSADGELADGARIDTPDPRDGTACDVVGVLLLAACACWAVYSSSGRDAQPEGTLLGLLAIAAGYATGRIAGAVLPVGAPLAAAGAAAALAPWTGAHLHDDDALAALLSLAVGAACCAGYAAQAHGMRRIARGCGALAVLLVAESLTTDSMLGPIACGGTLVVAVAVHRARRRVPALTLLSLCVLLTLGATVLLAQHSGATVTGPSPRAYGPVTQVSSQRLALWRDAVREFDQQPLRGVGPGRFTDVSPTALESTEPTGASSSALQTAAEQGLPGVLLLGAAFGWTLWTLARSPRPTAAVLSTAAAMAALGVQATVASVLSVAWVVVGGGLLLGMTAARPMPRVRRERDPG
ncbi:O-antigen ligase family protein [Streptacidiphilus fuscans]|uniref:O-antigen ligase family protein n=1 Tax=Streptacidiphilus fuscans TaxID=2789292 RepID=A0A931FCR0_9ACTN|nr:O-antigen ligase family protein [Streptacidiphilus fuscans]MBF9069992.1 O-antigen ligase family protein [Streptacidiphilus fuscans]